MKGKKKGGGSLSSTTAQQTAGHHRAERVDRHVLLSLNAAEYIPKPHKIISCLSSSFSFPPSLPPASALRSHLEEMIDHIWNSHARTCLAVVKVGSQPSSNQWGRDEWNNNNGGGKSKKEKSRVRYFHVLVCYLTICSKKACGSSSKICQQHGISSSPALLPVLITIWIMFPSHRHSEKSNQKSTTLLGWAQTSQDTESKALKLLLSFLIPCSNRTEGK